ncbi:hypothetical protein ACOME3_006298 [Neoechinorhynchus agilis]
MYVEVFLDQTNVCYYGQTNDVTYYLSTNEQMPMIPVENELIRPYISRCAVHSMSMQVPSCPGEWEWQSYSSVMARLVFFRIWLVVVKAEMSHEAGRQTSLPVSSGGLFIRNIADISLPAYLGSYEANRRIVQSFLGANYTLDEDFVEALNLWGEDSGSELVLVNGCKQSVWNSPLIA